MDPRAEAAERLGGRYEARVLEPSPPAVSEPPWFADDPVARGDVPPARQVVSPVPTGDLLWADLASEDADLAEWCAERWLAAYRRLPPVPAELVKTRQALHRLAETVISPAREAANGKIGLRYTRGGFGTPFFGDDLQIRVEGTELVSGERREPLDVDPQAAAFLGDCYGFAASVLEELRAVAGAQAEPSRVQLWPEHFDLAVELGRESDGVRAACGVSPGDDEHPEPYLYVAPWSKQSAYAELAYSALLQAEDQRMAALDFLRRGLDALTR